jgi:hypothetical protein
MQKLIRGVLVLALAASGGAVLATPAEAAPAKTYKNCAELNQKYKHGVGKKGATDKVRGSTKAVTNFYVNTKLYNANKSRDRDSDGVACEKR